MPTHSRLQGLAEFLDRILAGPVHADPLYLSNQTFGQKVRRILLLAVALVLVIAGALAALSIYVAKTRRPPRELTPAEVAEKILPNFNGNIKFGSNQDLEVVEIHFDPAGGLMAGNLRNKTDRLIHEAVVVFDLVDLHRSQLGGVTVTETNLAPGATRMFRRAIEQKNAAYAQVREVRTQ